MPARWRCSSETATSSASIRCASPIPPPTRRGSSAATSSGSVPAGAPCHGCPATTAPASRSRCSTPASTRHIPTSAAACSRESTSSTRTASPLARPHPHDPALVERHGTQMAGLLVGDDGPAGLRGAAPGASLLPIRVAGWQPSAEGGFAVYGRTDQLLAGLERAVDPDADGSTLDAARVALVGVAEPFAAFSDGPLARAAAGAARLDTLVVAPAGNDGDAGPDYGSISGPGGAPAALTVGAVDARQRTPTTRMVVRAGLRVLLDQELPLAGAVAPDRELTLALVRPGAEPRAGLRSDPLGRFFDARGYSLVAGKAALLERSAAPAEAGRRAALAGAQAVVVDGTVPAGALGLDERIDVPVVGLPAAVAREARRLIASGAEVTVSLGAPGWSDNPDGRRVALFSSHGLAFGGGVKPEVTAAGVELVTADIGQERGQVGAVRDDQRHERSRCARRGGGGGPRPGAARPGRARAEGRPRRRGRPHRRRVRRRTGRRRDRCRRRSRRRGGRGARDDRLRRSRPGGLAGDPPRHGHERVEAAPAACRPGGRRGHHGHRRHREADRAAYPARPVGAADGACAGRLPAAQARRDLRRDPPRPARRRVDGDPLGGGAPGREPSRSSPTSSCRRRASGSRIGPRPC